MTWQKTTHIFPDRVCAALAYVLPLAGSVIFAKFVLRDMPVLAFLLFPAFPLLQVYNNLPLGQLIVFIVLLVGVVRNASVSHFIRFNVMQAILLDIVLFLASLFMSYILDPIVSGTIVQEILYSTVFLGILAAVIYGVIESFMGIYPDKIPGVSQATHYQVPF